MDIMINKNKEKYPNNYLAFNYIAFKYPLQVADHSINSARDIAFVGVIAIDFILIL
jgi:hypothetical protein